MVLDCAHRTPSPAPAGHPYVAIPDIQQGRVVLETTRRITDEDLLDWTRRTKPRAGDILVTRRGRVGDTAPIPTDDCAIGQNLVILRSDGTVIDQSFLRWATRGPAWQSEVDRLINVGAVFSSLNVGDIGKMRIPVLPLPEQQAIAEVLGALDDKIAANHALANTADDLVRSLYAELNASTITIADLARNTRDAWAPGNEATTYVGLEHLPRRHMWLTDSGAPESVTSNKSRFKAGDVLFGKLRPYFHKVVSAPTSGVCSTDILVIRAFDPGMQGLVLAATSSDKAVNACTIASSGTKMPRTNWKTLGACPVRCGSTAQNLKVSHKIMTIRDAVEAQLRASSTLAALRDTLLPALMDGTLRVKDAEKTVSEAL
ncbi:restriction endonuclease subunit S [Cutibacterium sp. V970]|uniref:restriction endonuclease subunit S n=1 Tax=Cutibacterium sp. V970 TaxID=3446481 RepID=UPI003EE15F2A